jgi:transcriptional regulator with XRE-family HTH domain
VNRNLALADFLRARRARLTPADVGLPDSPRRRTPGLRREDVARLADVSVEYYTRLEQGRKLRPSHQVIDALVRALRLSNDERHYLAAIASPGSGADPLLEREQVRPGIVRLLRHLDHLPCVVMGRYFEILKWNQLAAALIFDFERVPCEERNLLRLLILEERVRSRYVNFAEVVQRATAQLRAVAVVDPTAPELCALVQELSAKCEVFRDAWHSQDVKMNRYGKKTLNHPEVGLVELEYEVLMPGESSGPFLVIHTVEPGSPSATALELLRMITREAGNTEVGILPRCSSKTPTAAT